MGQRVVTLVNAHQNAGTHTVSFNASNLTSGINAFVQARNHNQNLPDISFGLPLESGGEGVKATLRFNF